MKLICANTFHWINTVPPKSFDHVITDYPYGTTFPFEKLLGATRGTIITFCSEKDDPFSPVAPSERAYWIKTPSTKNYTKHLGRFVEHIHIYRQSEYEVFNADLHWSQYTGVYTDLVDAPNGHQWQKPLSLMERLVRIYTKPGDLILDPFCGSGQTLKAAEKWGRGSVGVDIDPKWVEYCEKL